MLSDLEATASQVSQVQGAAPALRLGGIGSSSAGGGAGPELGFALSGPQSILFPRASPVMDWIERKHGSELETCLLRW